MTTAREQAREAARLGAAVPDWREHVPMTAVEAADAASDIWEPMLRVAVEILEPFVKSGQTRLGESADWLKMKEALDG